MTIENIMPTYTLVDAEDYEGKSTDGRVFEIPTLAERMSVPDGGWAKLGFLLTDAEKQATDGMINAERMWVEVECRESDNGVYYGKLGNHPVFVNGVTINDSIQFEAKHIMAIAA